MPSANETLSGDTKTFESWVVSLIVRQSANEYAFDASSTLCSLVVSARGSAVSAGRWPPAGELGSCAQATRAVAAARANVRRNNMKPPDDGRAKRAKYFGTLNC